MTITVSQNINRLTLTVEQELNSVIIQPVINKLGSVYLGNIDGGTPTSTYL